MRCWFTTGMLLPLVLAGSSVHSQVQTVYEPLANNPRIIGALEGERRMERAGEPFDLAAMERVFAPDLIVHSPINYGRQS